MTRWDTKRRCVYSSFPCWSVYNRPTSRKLFWMIMSFTAAMTNLICFVSVAQVKWVYICFVSDWFRETNRLRIYSLAASYVFGPAGELRSVHRVLFHVLVSCFYLENLGTFRITDALAIFLWKYQSCWGKGWWKFWRTSVNCKWNQRASKLLAFDSASFMFVSLNI